MKKLMFIEVKGTRSTWNLHFYGDPAHLPDWRADGLVVQVIENTVPMLVAERGLVRPWIFMQDVLNFKNPFAK